MLDGRVANPLAAGCVASGSDECSPRVEQEGFAGRAQAKAVEKNNVEAVGVKRKSKRAGFRIRLHLVGESLGVRRESRDLGVTKGLGRNLTDRDRSRSPELQPGADRLLGGHELAQRFPAP